jgi:predicted dehydrogenase
MHIPGRVRRYIGPFIRRIRSGNRSLREAKALREARLNVQLRLAKRGGRVAVVGCGVMGRNIAWAAKMCPNWTVPAVYDQRTEAARELKERIAPEAVIYETMDSLLSSKGLWDVLAIATWAPSHVPLTMMALQAGLRTILLEKPVATRLADVDMLINAASDMQARIAVDHTRRWIHACLGIRRLIESGVIGGLRAIHFVYGRAGFAMIGTHLFDFARLLVGAEIVKLRADLDDVARRIRWGEQFVDRSGRCEGFFSNNVRFTVDLSDGLSLQQRLLIIVGEYGRIEVDERLNIVRLVGPAERVWNEVYPWQDAVQLGVARSLLELITKNQPSCTLQDGRAALEATIACQLSSREDGRWVTLPLVGEICEEDFPFA